MKTIFSIIVLFFLYTPFISSAELELNITVSKTIYLTAEPIEVGINLKNNTNQTIKTKIPHPGISTLELNIISDKGNLVPFTGYIACGGENVLELQPNEEYYQLFVLDELYGNAYSSELPNRSIEPGNYSIQAVFKAGGFNISSNMVAIEIVPPSGSELNVYNKFLQVTNNLNYRNKQDVLTACNNFLSLVQRNPSSVYSPVILVQLSALYKISLHDAVRSTQIQKKMLEEYPGSGKCKHYITSILDGISLISDKIDYLQRVKTRSEGSLMEKIYNDKISEIK